MKWLKNIFPKILVASLLFFTFSLAYADSPVTSVEFGQAYVDAGRITEKEYADRNALIKNLADPKISCGKKIALINLYGWDEECKCASSYLDAIKMTKDSIVEKGNAEQLAIYSYLLVLDGILDFSDNQDIFCTRASYYAQKAIEKNSPSFSVNFAASLVKAQNYFKTNDWGSAYAILDTLLCRQDLTMDILPSCISYAFEYMKGYKNFANKTSYETAKNFLTLKTKLEYSPVTGEIEEIEIGKSPKTFSVSPTLAVKIAPGDLMYNMKGNFWKFNENQYKFNGYNVDDEGVIKNDVWKVYFLRGTSGFRYVSPSLTKKQYESYSYQNVVSGSIADTNYDWGKYNKIENGGNKAGIWRTLTDDEFEYLAHKRKNAKYLCGRVAILEGNDFYNCDVFLPDDFEIPEGLEFVSFGEYDNGVLKFNRYTISQWEKMEAAGAVIFNSPKEYWLSSERSNTAVPGKGNVFGMKDLGPYVFNAQSLTDKCSVRLVQDAGTPVNPDTIPDIKKEKHHIYLKTKYPVKDVLAVYEAFVTYGRMMRVIFYEDGTLDSFFEEWQENYPEWDFDGNPNHERMYYKYKGNPLKDKQITFVNMFGETEEFKVTSNGRLAYFNPYTFNYNETTYLDLVYKKGDKENVGGKLYDMTPNEEKELTYLYTVNEINKDGMTIGTRFNPPAGYERKEAPKGSITEFYRNYPMFPSTHHVTNCFGQTYSNTQVLKMDLIGDNIQQCADAAMRLRCEYLFNQKQYDKISFHVSNGNIWSYNNYLKNYNKKISEESLRDYMFYLFSWCGSKSLDDYDTVPVAFNDIRVGDIACRGGTPGHVATIVDIAYPTDGSKDTVAVLFAQSYQPAQETEIIDGRWFILSEYCTFDAGVYFTTEEIKRYK